MSAHSDDGDIPSLPSGATLTRLDNGLTIIVREDHSAPVVSAQAWCAAGSVHEGRWLGAGLSHVLEHMLFKGTTTRPGSRIDQEVQDAGGQMNAYTSFDRTVYHIDAPNTGAQVAIDILCDIMQNATLPSDELEKEKQVILREMDMNVDDPQRRSSRRLFETAYTRSPYRFTIIGYPDLFHQLKQEDILAYYHEKYAPNNVFFVVVGDIARDDVVTQIKAAYAATGARPMAPVFLPAEPPQMAPREIIEEAPIELGYGHVAWHIPELRHPDVPALDVLAVLLGSGRSSRLYQRLREQLGIVHSVDAWTYSPGNPGLFGASVCLDPNKLAAARTALLTEVERMKTELVGADELRKAVKQFVASNHASRKTMAGQAQDLGSSWLAADDLNFSERYLAAIKRVTPADLQNAARLYLTAENRTTYALLPSGSAAQAVTLVETVRDHPVEKFEFRNGLRLLVKEDHRLPFVEFRAVFRGGVLAETPATSGITQLTGKLLLKGTARRSAEQIALEIESVGGHIDSYGGNNSFGINAEVLSEDFALGLDLLSDVLRHPTFPAAALEREREIQLASIRAQKDHLLQSAFKLMRRTLFGPTGYGLDLLGQEESVGSFRPDDLQAFYRAHAVPNNCVLAIYGDVNPTEARCAVEAALAEWSANPQLKTLAPAAVVRPASLQRASEARDKKQAVLVLGSGGTDLRDPDRHALDLLQEACSDLGSRLFLRVREKLGLAYYVGAQNFVGLSPGYFAFYAGTKPEAVAQVEEEFLKEVELLRTEGLSPEELQRAKAKIIGQRKIARQDLGGYASTTALDELYGLGYRHTEAEEALYQAVTPEQVKAAANKYLIPDACVVATIVPG